MQKTKTIQIGSRSFTLKELPVRKVWALMNNEGEQPMLDRCRELLKLGCPELDADALLDLYPSEIKEIWQAFEEVNVDFLEIVRLIGLDQALIDAVRTSVATSIKQFAILLPLATVPSSGTMDMASSSQQ
jgi:hypothetical protein